MFRGNGPEMIIAAIETNCTVTRIVDFMHEYMKKIIIALPLLFALTFGQFRQPNSAELQIAVNKLSVVGSVLYIAAHPDDENTALLSYFAKGRMLRTGYLSITRGEGGQNLVGSEQGAELGLIRTQELLAARSVDGAEQYFTRAIDFGYSKSSEEALRLWNKDSVLGDVVWVIRKFRPDVIITRFSPTQGGHGHHLASAVLAEEAFRIAGDSAAYPEQLKFVRPWKTKRLLFNHFRFGGNNPNPQNIPTFKIDVGEYHPLLGRSYTELAGISRTMHKSQAMGSAQNKGTSMNDFVITAGDTAVYDIFDDVDLTWNRMPGGKKLVRMATDIKKRFLPAAPEKSIPGLLRFYAELQKINFDPLVNVKMQELESVIRSCLGLSIEARADNSSYTRSDSIKIRMHLLNRSSSNVVVTSLYSRALAVDRKTDITLMNNEPLVVPIASVLPQAERFTQPYWLTVPPQNNRYGVSEPELTGNAENAPQLTVAVGVTIDETPFLITVPIQYVWVDDLEGERSRNCALVPPVSVELAEHNIVWNEAPSKKITVRLRAHRNGVNGTVLLRSNTGWILATMKEFSLAKKGNETALEFIVYRDTTAGSGTITAEATVEGEIYRSGVKEIAHPHIPVQTLFVPASAHSLLFDLNTKGKIIGYIMGAGDDVPRALEQMGYTVSMIGDEELHSGTFSRYDAVVAGVRAYNTHPQLIASHPSLMRYVQEGGTYVVQYQVLEKGQTDNLGPYPLEISRNRVTDENAAVTFVDAQHPLLTGPNKITASDFDGWVQERGLYFPVQWDAKYEPVISAADPNEQPQSSSILFTRYGKGHYIFTGLSFFRQLPAGVPGAYRLFANMLSVGKQ
jgi:LmbE family N-acetylglucosaminyl deacetylase